MQVAIYGKGGIGKSTLAANISAALAAGGQRVLQVGCDPKHDSTRLLLRGQTPPTVLDYIRDVPPNSYRASDIIRTGEFGVDCVEAGGPEPGIGCAGRGILSTFELLDSLGVRARGYDVVLYDVLGDVVCGGFAVPIRNEYADKVYIVTSGEFMSLYAANNILRGLLNYQTDRPRVGGIIFNSRAGAFEAERVACFAEAVDLPIVATIPRSEAFAKSERACRCLVAAAPETDLSKRLQALAETILSGPLYPAAPLSDAELERRVLAQPGPVGLAEPVQSEAVPGTVAGGAVDAVSSVAKTTQKGDVLATDNTISAILAPAQPLLSKSLRFREPLHGCAFSGALSITSQLADCVTVAHGPRSCAHIAYQALTSISRRLLLERGIVLPMQTAPAIVSTDMNEAVMIFGGGAALEERIRALQKRQPAAIFVVSTCPSGIIGEDLAATVKLSTDRTRVIPISADGNLSGDYLQGVFMAYQSIAEALIDRQVKPEPDLVNLVAEKTIATATADNLGFLNTILARLGLRLNCRFLCESDFTQVQGFLKAPLNLLAHADYMGQALRGYLEKSFGARFFEQPLPVGFIESQNWVTALAAHYGQPEVATAIIADYRRRYDAEVARLRPLLAGRRLMVVTFNHDIDWILATALDVGMEISFVGILNYSQDTNFRTVFADAIGELQTDIDYSALARSQDLARIAPDVLLGNYLPEGDIAVPLSDTFPLCPSAGFFSGLEMAARWAEMLRMNLSEGWRQDADIYRKYHS